MNQQYCFCTLAIGKSYRNCAILLAKDLELYAPETELIVLTDNPSWFEQQPNIKAIRYRPVSCRIYNDKRLVIEHALEFYESCIFVDANIRIKGPILPPINFKPGIVAYSCYNILKSFYKEGKNLPDNRRYKQRNERFKLLQQVSSYYNLKFEDIKFIFEGVFYVTKNNNYEKFVRYWEILAEYHEYSGLYDEEGIVIGLAAAIANFPINYDYEKRISLFKDVLEKHKMKVGNVIDEETRTYLETLQNLEHPQVSLIQKILRKLNREIGFYSRLIKLKIRVLKYRKIFAEMAKTAVIELKNFEFFPEESIR